MSLLSRLFSRPGYYELVGGPQVGKTTAACLLARMHGAALFLGTPEEESPTIYEATGVGLAVYVRTVADFFEIVGMTEPGVLVVLDSLATLKPDHPGSKQIAGSINRHIVMPPPCPVLVVNQERFPIEIGGVLWRASRSGVFRLIKYRERPFLLSHLWPTSLYLIWKDKPGLRALSDEERKTWLPDVAYAGV